MLGNKSPRRTRKGKVQVLVRERKHRFRKARTYWRPLRKKGKKRIVGKKAIRLFPITDEFGHRLGFKQIKKKKK